MRRRPDEHFGIRPVIGLALWLTLLLACRSRSALPFVPGICRPWGDQSLSAVADDIIVALNNQSNDWASSASPSGKETTVSDAQRPPPAALRSAEHRWLKIPRLRLFSTSTSSIRPERWRSTSKGAGCWFGPSLF
jgi:hypothetical protein